MEAIVLTVKSKGGGWRRCPSCEIRNVSLWCGERRECEHKGERVGCVGARNLLGQLL